MCRASLAVACAAVRPHSECSRDHIATGRASQGSSVRRRTGQGSRHTPRASELAPPGDRYRPRRRRRRSPQRRTWSGPPSSASWQGLRRPPCSPSLRRSWMPACRSWSWRAVGGLAVGLGVRRGAWYGLAHVSRRSPSALAVGLALVTLGGMPVRRLPAVAGDAGRLVTDLQRAPGQPAVPGLALAAVRRDRDPGAVPACRVRLVLVTIGSAWPSS